MSSDMRSVPDLAVHDNDNVDDYVDNVVCCLYLAQLLRKSLPATIGEYKNHPL